MAIEKNSFKGSRLDHELSPNSKETTSSDDEEEVKYQVSADESDDDDDEFDDADSGAGSDDFDLLELGETGAEFCQIGNSTCSVPFELYDLSGLEDILSIDVWNEVLTEEERFSLTKYLPDLDQDTYMRTVKELLEGQNFHFGSPVKQLFVMLKGGLCEPRVALYREGLNLFRKRQHYHLLRNHQNTMVSNLCQMRNAWFNCRGYSIEEKLRVLNIMKSEKNLMIENMEEGLASDSSDKAKNRKSAAKLGQNSALGVGSSLEFPPRMPLSMGLEVAKYGKQNPKGILKLASRFPSVYQGIDVNSRPYGLPLPLPTRFDVDGDDGVDVEDALYGVDIQRDRNMAYSGSMDKTGVLKVGKKREIFRSDELAAASFSGFPFAMKNDVHAYGRAGNASQLSNRRSSREFGRKAKYPENVPQYNRAGLVENGEPIWHSNNEGISSWKAYGSSSPAMNDRILLSELRSRPSQEKIRGSFVHNGGPDKRTKKMKRMIARNEETESDSSEQIEEEENSNLLIRGKFVNLVPKKGMFVKKTMEDSPLDFNGMTEVSKKKGKMLDCRKRSHKLGKYGHLVESDERSHNIGEENDSLETRLLADENAVGRLGRKGHVRSDKFNSVAKKRKAREELTEIDGRDEDVMLPSNGQLQMDESVPLKKKGKRKVEAEIGTADTVIIDIPFSEIGAAEMEIEAKPQKKAYTPITPTVHTGFSFSIIHLLSAVRMAMIGPLAEDSLEVGKKSDEQLREKHEMNPNEVVLVENNAEAGKSNNVNNLKVNNNSAPSLTLHEIVNRVRSNPGDPCILETQEPLQDLVRGVLKIFASKTAPLGAKGWKSLVVYQKSAKSWSWIGPTSECDDTTEEVTSPEYWVLPHKMIVKLVDSFANWLKSGQETLQQIGTLPAPPASLMQANLDEKERFRDLRAQKSLSTINPSSEEVRDYFRKEEILRYSIPDRVFSYTAADGKKSIVAPLRRCGGKPTSKARDHFMLKRDRPPHVTILCLVRDAASRLPGSIGTRADVCTLIRDSQYIVEDVSDAQVNQVVSGALDRLHYERDPCVQFDGDRKLWVYLHRDREEEDFEDDGTSSTKKWKRQKKDPADQSEQPVVTGFDLGSDLNVEPPGNDDDKRTEFVCNDEKQIVEENEGHPMVWDDVGLNPVQGDKLLLCQENSTNEDFDEEAFGRERAVGMLSAGLL